MGGGGNTIGKHRERTYREVFRQPKGFVESRAFVVTSIRHVRLAAFAHARFYVTRAQHVTAAGVRRCSVRLRRIFSYGFSDPQRAVYKPGVFEYRFGHVHRTSVDVRGPRRSGAFQNQQQQQQQQPEERLSIMLGHVEIRGRSATEKCNPLTASFDFLAVLRRRVKRRKK